LFQTDPIPLKISKEKVKNCLCKRTWICWEQCEDIEKKRKKKKKKKKGNPAYIIMTVLKGQFHILKQTPLNDYRYTTKITF
jgi:transcription antitermination factor NusG